MSSAIMSNSTLFRGLVFIVALLLSACATPPKPPVDSESLTWQLQGKIGFWQGRKQESATINWAQCDADSARIRLSGPLGTGSIELSSDQSGARLIQNGESIHADSIEELASRADWPIPVEALRFWVRGRAMFTEKLEGRVNTNGQLEELNQIGWHISYHYHTPFHQLPDRIHAKSANARITLIVSEWQEQPEFCAK